MASGLLSCSILLSFLLVSMFAREAIARKMMSDKEDEEKSHLIFSVHREKAQTDDPSVNIFFTIDGLKMGKKMPIYFSKKDPSRLPPLLSRKEADSIPFSTSNLSSLLEFFSTPKDSPQAKAMASTLESCELEPSEGETKFCATSLESMLDSAREILGLNTKLKVMTTKFISKISNCSLQNYTVMETPKELLEGNKVLGCHQMPYPYAVYYCHNQGGGGSSSSSSISKVFEISLVGERYGDIVVGPALCHMDTTAWDPDHVSFQVLGIEPGSEPVCHVFPLDDLVWIVQE